MTKKKETPQTTTRSVVDWVAATVVVTATIIAFYSLVFTTVAVATWAYYLVAAYY